LLQNSIDACLLRQKLSELWGIEYTPKVKVSLYTKNNVDYLQVSDNGVGMNQHIIDNYYTNIGCSYYSSREFSDLMVSFKSSFTPISRFGIGILSCFMVCDSMEQLEELGKDLSVMRHYMYPLKDTKVFLLFRIRTRKTLELTQY